METKDVSEVRVSKVSAKMPSSTNLHRNVIKPISQAFTARELVVVFVLVFVLVFIVTQQVIDSATGQNTAF